MISMASQITSLAIVYSTVNWGADQRKHQSSTSLAFVRGIHRWPVNSPHKGPVTRKIFPFDGVIIHWGLVMHICVIKCDAIAHCWSVRGFLQDTSSKERRMCATISQHIFLAHQQISYLSSKHPHFNSWPFSTKSMLKINMFPMHNKIPSKLREHHSTTIKMGNKYSNPFEIVCCKRFCPHLNSCATMIKTHDRGTLVPTLISEDTIVPL